VAYFIGAGIKKREEVIFSAAFLVKEAFLFKNI